jgi:hypothetical protein
MKFNHIAITSVTLIAVFMLSLQALNAQEEKVKDLYEEGTVWNVTYVRTHANMDDQYLKGLAITWGAAMEKYVDAGLIVSYKILVGEASYEDDFNMMLMMEFENFAAFDPDPEKDAKFEEIQKHLMEEMGDKYTEILENYPKIREIFGSKTLREMMLKK